ncbi:hypothetical protein [Methylobacterium oryzihabitans]|uniref:Uncharacterized protein n=1 Tax=Methylobacterium oryzihabitans TaxID=2499852 RepID=A0A3S2VQY7_9HYPH|nr:hypothetical protein [Methylobacterium oryzihabitans]RVU18677.1 hypothetical protein EOE48_09835 [Methylobacterium oryzihabitans]
MPRPIVTAEPETGRASWHRDLAALERLLRASRAPAPSRERLAALIEAEAPGALPAATRDRLAARLAAYLGGETAP